MSNREHVPALRLTARAAPVGVPPSRGAPPDPARGDALALVLALVAGRRPCSSSCSSSSDPLRRGPRSRASSPPGRAREARAPGVALLPEMGRAVPTVRMVATFERRQHTTTDRASCRMPERCVPDHDGARRGGGRCRRRAISSRPSENSGPQATSCRSPGDLDGATAGVGLDQHGEHGRSGARDDGRIEIAARSAELSAGGPLAVGPDGGDHGHRAPLGVAPRARGEARPVEHGAAPISTAKGALGFVTPPRPDRARESARCNRGRLRGGRPGRQVADDETFGVEMSTQRAPGGEPGRRDGGRARGHGRVAVRTGGVVRRQTPAAMAAAVTRTGIRPRRAGGLVQDRGESSRAMARGC